ncbi:MAG: hypothetical protein EZS28_007320 [Streblomastix strix]|uniref:Uncharacterized protein n=1 Tax=Streblomastix strix TaxID=222440 RepID=A0A5J4WRW6_9EUKA|nr:MAG: hypothetical protein EZS28_007320 [Streblomastix strix]
MDDLPKEKERIKLIKDSQEQHQDSEKNVKYQNLIIQHRVYDFISNSPNSQEVIQRTKLLDADTKAFVIYYKQKEKVIDPTSERANKLEKYKLFERDEDIVGLELNEKEVIGCSGEDDLDVEDEIQRFAIFAQHACVATKTSLIFGDARESIRQILNAHNVTRIIAGDIYRNAKQLQLQTSLKTFWEKMLYYIKFQENSQNKPQENQPQQPKSQLNHKNLQIQSNQQYNSNLWQFKLYFRTCTHNNLEANLEQEEDNRSIKFNHSSYLNSVLQSKGTNLGKRCLNNQQTSFFNRDSFNKLQLFSVITVLTITTTLSLTTESIQSILITVPLELKASTRSSLSTKFQQLIECTSVVSASTVTVANYSMNRGESGGSPAAAKCEDR